MKNVVVFLALLGTTAAVPTIRAQGGSTAQQQPPTVASVLNMQYGIVEQEVVSAAEAMPEDKYSFAPTNGEFKGVRNFAEEVKHIGFANHLFFGPLMGETINTKSIEENANGPAALKTKAEIVQYLKDSFALGHRALSGITAENAVTPLPQPVFPFLSTRLAIASIGNWHAMDHYGQMVEYLRLAARGRSHNRRNPNLNSRGIDFASSGGALRRLARATAYVRRAHQNQEMALEIPSGLAANCRKSAKRTAWLARLPTVLRELVREWSLRLGAAFDGEADEDVGAMLLECCEPGTVLRDLEEREQDVVIAGLLRHLWRNPATPHPFRPLSALTEYWSSETSARVEDWPDAELVREGLRLFAELPPAARVLKRC